MLMTKEIWKTLLSARPPYPNFEFQPVEYDGYINLRVFTDNFAEFSQPQQESLALFIGMLVKRVRDLGVPCYIEKVPGRKRSNR